ncbi:MAG: response regulator [Myxococcales bacterium]|nr:response regulator [Myxococcales bacterium]
MLDRLPSAPPLSAAGPQLSAHPVDEPKDAALRLVRFLIRTLTEEPDPLHALQLAIAALTAHFKPMSTYLVRVRPREKTWLIQALQPRLGVCPPLPIGEPLPLDARMVRAFSQMPRDGGILHWSIENPPADADFWRDALGIETAMAARLHVPHPTDIWVLAMDRQAVEGDWSSADGTLFADVALAFAQRLEVEQAHGALQQQNSVLHALVDTQSDLVWTAGLDGSVDFVSAAWTQVTSLAAISCQGWGWMAAVHPDDLPDCAHSWQSAIDRGVGWQMRVRMRDIANAGVWRTFDLKTVALRDDNGLVIKWLGRGQAGDMSDAAWRTPPTSGHEAAVGPIDTRSATDTVRILVVDDVQDNRSLVKAFLRKTAWQVDEADSGFGAIEKCAKTHYDCIIMDVHMPDMTGLAAAQAIRRLEHSLQRTAAPIVAITAHTLETDRAASLAAGCQAFLSKPIGQRDLLGTMKLLIRGQSTAST